MAKQKKVYNPNIISNWKRFLTYLADLAIFLILTITIYSIAAVPLAKAITPFNKFKEDTSNAYKGCMDFAVQSKLIEYEDDEEKNALTTLEDDLKRFVTGDIYETNGEFAEIFAYFYTDFANTKMTLENSKTYNVSYVNTYALKVNQLYSPFELDGGDESKLAVLKADAKIDLENYLIKNEINATSQKTYDTAINIFKESWTDATNLISQSKEFQELAAVYSKNNNKILLIYSVSSIITFVICFFLYYLLVPSLFKKGQTLAKKILHVGVFNEDGSAVSFKTLLVRSILLFIFSLSFYLLLPMFEVGANIVNLPLFIVGDYVIYAFSPCFVTLVCAAFSFIISANSLNHQSLHDLVLHTVVLKENPDIIEDKEKLEMDKDIEDGSSI